MSADADICVVSIHKMGAGFEQGSVLHQQGDLVDTGHLSACADLLMTTSPNVMAYAAMDGWRRQMVEHGHELLGATMDVASAVRSQIDLIPDLKVLEEELLGAEASYDLDRLQVLIDVARTGRSGYQAADWLRRHCQIDVGMSDHRRILATLSIADDMSTGRRLVAALRSWRRSAYDIVAPPAINLPAPGDLALESDCLPRDAFFAPAESIALEAAAGRICAEQLTPYPPGIPAVVPGERLNEAVIDYLRSGVLAGMNVPDATDTSLRTIKVVA